MKNNLITLENNHVGLVTPKDDEYYVIPTSLLRKGILIGIYPESITEEQAREMVKPYFIDGKVFGYLKYNYKNTVFDSSLDSLKSIFESEGIDLVENKIVIIKIK